MSHSCVRARAGASLSPAKRHHVQLARKAQQSHLGALGHRAQRVADMVAFDHAAFHEDGLAGAQAALPVLVVDQRQAALPVLQRRVPVAGKATPPP